MIKVQRGEIPDGFESRAKDLRIRFSNESRNDPKLTISKFWTKIRRELVSDATILYGRFHGKCAFCESKMAHVSNAHIEHYYPKKGYSDKAFNWNNWLLSCEKCNHKKSTKFPMCGAESCLIDPANEDPEEHILFVNEFINPLTIRGEKTIKELVKLERSELEEERSRWLVHLACLVSILSLYKDNENSSVFQDVRTLLIWCMQNDAPYSSMAKCYLSNAAPKLARKSHPHVNPDNPSQKIIQFASSLKEALTEIE